MADSLDQKRNQLASLDAQLRTMLGPGLEQRLRDPGWYLTGVKVGLESLHAFYEISELVYREHTSRSEGGRRLARLRTVYEQLTRFARGGIDAAGRAQLMLEIRQPLQTLLHEFEFESAASGGPVSAQRKTIIGQLASDIRLSLIRERSFEKMEADLGGLLSFWFVFAPGKRKQLAERVRHDHIGYAEQLGFGKADALLRNEVVKTAILKAQRERKKLARKAELVHQKIYRDQPDAGAEDFRGGLAEQRILPRLQHISRAGLEYLHRAESAYEHALELVKGDVALLREVTALGLAIEDGELSADVRRSKAAVPSLPF